MFDEVTSMCGVRNCIVVHRIAKINIFPFPDTTLCCVRSVEHLRLHSFAENKDIRNGS